jgi:hypothetical protein
MRQNLIIIISISFPRVMSENKIHIRRFFLLYALLVYISGVSLKRQLKGLALAITITFAFLVFYTNSFSLPDIFKPSLNEPAETEMFFGPLMFIE